MASKNTTDLFWNCLFARKRQERSLSQEPDQTGRNEPKACVARQKRQCKVISPWRTKFIYDYDIFLCLVHFKSLRTNWADEIFTLKTCALTQSSENSLTRPLHTSAKRFTSMHACAQSIVYTLLPTKYIADLVWKSSFVGTGAKLSRTMIWPETVAPK